MQSVRWPRPLDFGDNQAIGVSILLMMQWKDEAVFPM